MASVVFVNLTRNKLRIASLEPRGLTRAEAAMLAGLSPAAFDKARKAGKYPGPTLPGGRFDLRLMYVTMDRHSALEDAGEASPLDQWRASRARTP